VRLSGVKWGLKLLGFLLVASLVVVPVQPGAASVEIPWMQTSRADFESGALAHLDVSGSPGDVKLAVAGIDYLYAFRGNNQKSFWRYTIALNTWTPMADAPDLVRWGGALAYDGGNYIYAFHGNSANDFWRYSISANSWSVMAGAPGAVREGGALTFVNGYVYALRGNNTRDFWRYNPAANSWTPRASTDNVVFAGGALTGDGGNCIYAFQGGGSNAFRRYDISADSWTLLTNFPAGAGAGAALAYDGSRYIYAVRGCHTSDCGRYDILTGKWWFHADLADRVEWGGSMTCIAGGYIYGLPGNYSQYLLRYNISANLLEARAGTPATVYDGAALVSGAARYYPSGDLISITRDTGYNADFGTISWAAVTPAGTSVKFQVAANSDNSTWVFKGPDGATGTYYTSGGAAIWSGHDGSRYIKYRAYFSTTNTAVTPVLNDVTITYSKQILIPAVSTVEASPVQETMAVLNGMVSNDGGEACQYRFQYGKSTGNYTLDTGWTGSVVTGGSFSSNVSGLVKGTKYYFRAQLKNSAGINAGPELSLLTRPDPPVVGTFSAKAVGASQINLSWVKGEGAKRTMVRRKTGTYPADINDGILVYFDTGAGVSDIGLAPGTTYYYSAWSEVTGSQQWSSGSQSSTESTLAGGPVAVGGTVFPVNKALIVAPWLGAIMLLLGSGGVVFCRLKKIKA
jgi:hypothetical protein